MVDVHGEDVMNSGCGWREMEDVDGEKMMSGGWRRGDEWWVFMEKM